MIGIAQLMVVLDVTVMNIALPSAQRALQFSTVDRQWVVTAYTLAFGRLLLLGGRLADLLGRKVTFLIGLIGFAGFSAVGGVLFRRGPLDHQDGPVQVKAMEPRPGLPSRRERTGRQDHRRSITPNPRRHYPGDSAHECPQPYAFPGPDIIIGLSDMTVTA